MKRLILLAIPALLGGCEAVDAQMRQQSAACAASGKVLTASGCAGGGFDDPAPRPKMTCSSRSRVHEEGDTTTTDTDTVCHE